MESLKGKLLIAVPNLEDGNFLRTVVLILHHDQFGASGVVLNRPTDVTVREAWKNAGADSHTRADQIVQNEKINIGGPVDGPLLVLHQNELWAEETVLPNVLLSAKQDAVEQLIQQPATEPKSQFRVFSGYSGWAPDQLESEIDAGGWMLIQATADHVFSKDDELWSQACEVFSASVIDLPVVTGADPNLN